MNDIKPETNTITNVYFKVLKSQIHIFVNYENKGLLDIFEETHQIPPVFDFYKEINTNNSICTALEKYYTKKQPRKNIQNFLIKKGLIIDDGTPITQFKNALDEFITKY